jgi:hypothetical protein
VSGVTSNFEVDYLCRFTLHKRADKTFQQVDLFALCAYRLSVIALEFRGTDRDAQSMLPFAISITALFVSSKVNGFTVTRTDGNFEAYHTFIYNDTRAGYSQTNHGRL